MLPQSLQQVLSAYPAGCQPRQWKPLGTAGFSGAVIVRIESDLGAFCLRGWPVRSLPKERILGLHRLLAHVHNAGFKEVAVPVAARTGETLVSWNNQHWQLEPWLLGSADYWSRPSRIRLSNAMSRLAMFHQLTQDYTDKGPARQWFFHRAKANSPAVAERLSYLRDWQRSKLAQLERVLLSAPQSDLCGLAREFVSGFRSLAPLIGAKLEILSRASFRLEPCLRDIWHDHVLFTDDEVTGLIDPSACRAENVAADLSRLLGSLLNDDREAWEFALREYETHRPLDADEKALVEALDQSGVLLSGMAWLDRLLLNREAVSDWPKVLDRLQTIRRRLQTLTGEVHRFESPK